MYTVMHVVRVLKFRKQIKIVNVDVKVQKLFRKIENLLKYTTVIIVSINYKQY